ncbi:MAG: global cell cycle regulator GcrA-like protein, partial [Alphaproteobacteria bacterium]|nr:global cell cycle regulator GcrA-like protein [Alphaproteobacteria bacterium]
MADSSNVWTDERLAELKKLWSEGLSISQIGE